MAERLPAGSARTASTPTATTFQFVVNNAADSILRPHEPHEGELVPVVATPAIARAAGPSGIVPLHIEDSIITGKIVATTRYFPSIDGDAVVADLPTWLTAANTAEPGVATASELWLDTPPARRSSACLASQRARWNELASDPLARGAIGLLLVTALVGAGARGSRALADGRSAIFARSAARCTISRRRARPPQTSAGICLLRAAVIGVLGLARRRRPPERSSARSSSRSSP